MARQTGNVVNGYERYSKVVGTEVASDKRLERKGTLNARCV